jgi:hypothetical protein
MEWCVSGRGPGLHPHRHSQTDARFHTTFLSVAESYGVKRFASMQWDELTGRAVSGPQDEPGQSSAAPQEK